MSFVETAYGGLKKPVVGTSNWGDEINEDLDAIGAIMPGSPTWLKTIVAGESLTYTSITRNGDGAPTTATVVWPDSTGGVWTADTLSSDFAGAVDAFHVTYLGDTTRTVTQPAVTRDSTGAVTVQPALVVS